MAAISPSVPTCSRSSNGSPRLLNRRAKCRTSGRCSSTRISRSRSRRGSSFSRVASSANSGAVRSARRRLSETGAASGSASSSVGRSASGLARRRAGAVAGCGCAVSAVVSAVVPASCLGGVGLRDGGFVPAASDARYLRRCGAMPVGRGRPALDRATERFWPDSASRVGRLVPGQVLVHGDDSDRRRAAVPARHLRLGRRPGVDGVDQRLQHRPAEPVARDVGAVGGGHPGLDVQPGARGLEDDGQRLAVRGRSRRGGAGLVDGEAQVLDRVEVVVHPHGQVTGHGPDRGQLGRRRGHPQLQSFGAPAVLREGAPRVDHPSSAPHVAPRARLSRSRPSSPARPGPQTRRGTAREPIGAQPAPELPGSTGRETCVLRTVHGRSPRLPGPPGLRFPGPR